MEQTMPLNFRMELYMQRRNVEIISYLNQVHSLADLTLLSLEGPILIQVPVIPQAQIQMAFCPHTLVVTH
jgi:hypothetical protein